MKLECPVRKWRGSFSLVLIGTTLWRRPKMGTCIPWRCSVPLSANPPDSYIIQVMAESSPSPFQTHSTSNVYFTGTLPQSNEPARPYSEYIYFEQAPYVDLCYS